MKAVAYTIAALLVALSQGSLAFASEYPTRPITMVVPFAPGGGLDTTMRIVAPEMSKRLGQPIIIENKAGAGGAIGAEAVKQAPPDGYTLLVYANTATIDPSYRPNLTYKFDRDFEPVSLVAFTPFFVVAYPGFAASSIAALISIAKEQPGKLNYGSAGVGTAAHLATELFKSQANVDIAHIPYRGSGPAIAAVMAGEVQFSFETLLQTKALAEANRLKILAVTTKARSPLLPSVPSISESGLPGYETAPWISIFAPRGTPPEIVAAVQSATAAAVNSEEVSKRLSDGGVEGVGSTSDELKQRMERETKIWARLIKDAGIKPE